MKVTLNRIMLKEDDKSILELINNVIQCQLCLNILNDPYDCSCCHQTYCKKCITDYINTNKKCPYPNSLTNKSEQSNDSHRKDSKKKKLLEGLHPSSSNIIKLINSLKFSCSYISNGCSSLFKLRELEDHCKTCKYQKEFTLASVSALSTFPINSNAISTLNTNISITASANNNDHLETYNIPNKEKFKFQDSSMSFRKVDICDFNNSPINNNQHFNHKIIDKIDKMYEMIVILSNEEKRRRSSINNNPKNTTSLLSEDLYSITNEKEEEKPLQKQVFKPKKINQANKELIAIDNISYKIDNIINKINTLEKTIQSIGKKKEENNMLFQTIQPNCTPKRPLNYKISDRRNNILNMSMNSTFNSTFQNMNSSNYNGGTTMRKKTGRSIIFNDPPKANKYHNKLNTSFKAITNTKEDNDEANINNLSLSKIEALLNENMFQIKQYIEGKCFEDLRKYYLDLTLDNSNLFVQKIDEVISLLPITCK